MNSKEQQEWLARHIPHRVRACIACLPIQEERMPNTADEEMRNALRNRFLLTAAFEGRMVAMRWLIEFVGICEKSGQPERPTPRKGTVSIDSLGGKEINLSSSEAKTLAKVWKGCSQASGHPTRDTNHLPLTDAVLDEALRII